MSSPSSLFCLLTLSKQFYRLALQRLLECVHIKLYDYELVQLLNIPTENGLEHPRIKNFLQLCVKGPWLWNPFSTKTLIVEATDR